MTRSPAWQAENRQYLAAALGVLTLRLVSDEKVEPAKTEWTSPEPPALLAMQEGFGLSDFERDILLLCAGVELDTSVARACAEAHGEPNRTWASFGLALSRLPEAHWSALSPAAPLRAHHLVSLSNLESLAVSALRIQERVLHALVGLDYLDPSIRPYSFPYRVSSDGFPRKSQDAAKMLARLWSETLEPRVTLHGHHRADLLAVGAAACAESGYQPIFLSGADLPTDAHECDKLITICQRENVLSPVGWVLDLIDTDESAHTSALRLINRVSTPMAILARQPLPNLALPRVDLAKYTVADREQIWCKALGEDVPTEELTRLAVQFDLSTDTVDAVVSECAADAGYGTVTTKSLWRGCQRHARPGIDAVAQRVETKARWDDLVLPAYQLAMLRQMIGHVRDRHLVLDQWGFGDLGGRGLGTSALFAGPSGTGKTLAAEVVAGELGLDLYRVDISRVVSKYIGETEKNLGRVFDAADAGGAVLLFDEADALFGKRSEVKDGLDRYANQEIGYLLQRIESYRGLAILTTNLKDALDHAFLRRLRFIVDFLFPDVQTRTNLWRVAFPATTPTHELDHDVLAQLSISGASIRNTAMFAAFLAADNGEAVTMKLVLGAARVEYAKLERQMTSAEIAGWDS